MATLSPATVMPVLTTVLRMSLWSLSLNIKLLTARGLRLRTALGLAIPTPTELRIMARIFREFDFGRISNLTFELLNNVSRMNGTPERFTDMVDIPQLNEFVARSFELTADEFAKDGKVTIRGYYKAIDRAVNNVAFWNYTAQVLGSAQPVGEA